MARNKTKDNGPEPDDTLPRMVPGYRQSGTYRDDFKDIPRRWGIPEDVNLVSLRDFCRQLGAAPLAVHRWESEGLPVIHYYPWRTYDADRARAWVEGRGIRPEEAMSPEQGRELMLLTLRAAAAGEASATEAVTVWQGIEHPVGSDTRPWALDPLWAEEWKAKHAEERKANARQYGLDIPTQNEFGVPSEVWSEPNVWLFEIRDITRRLGLSPFDMVKWTKEGMPALRCSPHIRWDVKHVAQWLAERGPLPKREYTIKELDSLEHFVIESVAAGEATPEEGRDVLACWVGTM